MNATQMDQKKSGKWFRAGWRRQDPLLVLKTLSRRFANDTHHIATKLLRVTTAIMLLGLISAAQLTYANSPPAYTSISTAADQSAVSAFQIRLRQAGYYKGPVTGVLDRATSVAIARFQTTHGLLGTGEIDQPTAQALGIHLFSPYLRPAT